MQEWFFGLGAVWFGLQVVRMGAQFAAFYAESRPTPSERILREQRRRS
jgi:hypothetical protein